MYVGVLTSSLTTRLNPGPLNQDVNLAVLDSFCDMSCHPSGVFLSMGDKGAEVSSLAQPDLSTDTVSESHPSGHPPIHLHLHSPTYPLPIHQPVHLLCLSIHPSPNTYNCSSFHPFILSVHSPIHIYIHPSIHRPITCSSIHKYMHPPTHTCIPPPVTCPTIHLSIHPSFQKTKQPAHSKGYLLNTLRVRCS